MKGTFWVKQRSSKAYFREMKITKQIEARHFHIHFPPTNKKALLQQSFLKEEKTTKGKRKERWSKKKEEEKNSVTIANQAMCSIKKNLCFLRNRSVIIGVKKKMRKKMASKLPNFKFLSILMQQHVQNSSKQLL